MKALSFGEVLWDVYPDKKFIGGAPFNFAAHLAKHGADVYMLSALGKDELGGASISSLRKFGLHDDFVAFVNDKESGKCLVSLDKDGVPKYNLLEDVAYDYISIGSDMSNFDLLYFGSLALRSEYNLSSLKKLLSENDFGEVFADVNIRPPFYSKETVKFCMQNASIVKISDEELPLVLKLLDLECGSSYEELSIKLAENNKNLKLILLTLGADGAFAFDCRSNEAYSTPGLKVNVASTVGAGDSFSAAFISRYLDGHDITSCLKHASKIAAYVVSNYEAIPEYSLVDF